MYILIVGPNAFITGGLRSRPSSTKCVRW